MQDTLIEARERQRMADMQRGIYSPYPFSLDPKTVGLQQELDNINAKVHEAEEKLRADSISKIKEEAKKLSNRELLEEIYIMFKIMGL